MPKSVFYIIGNEFCERFSYYGMKAILAIYLVKSLGLTENVATIVIHSFNFFAYFFSLLGGLIADCWLGKYRTISYLSVAYVFGITLLSTSSLPLSSSTCSAWLAFSGLALLALGTGGIKPCVSSFGGDQFDEFDVERVSRFFSIFYFTINAGSVLSMLITPILRKDVHCFGRQSCFPIAFGLPALLMLIALLIFICGKSLYKHIVTEGTSIISIWNVYRDAFIERRKAVDKSKPLLEYARAEYPPELITSIIELQRVLIILLPAPFFWALYDQQGSRWTFQAMRMDNHILGWTIKPEQMQLLNALLILCCIPLFQKIIYPLARRFGFRCSSVQKISCGMFLAILSFLSSALLESKIEQGTFAPPSDKTIDNAKCIKNCVNISWQAPQYFLLTFGEILFSITGLEFAYSQAPTSMKSFCQSFWLIMVAVGNLIVIMVTWINPFGRFGVKHYEVCNYLCYASLLFIGLIALQVLSIGYEEKTEYLELPLQNEPSSE